MSSKREDILCALFERLKALKGVDVRRNVVIPLKIPTGGLVVLRDGDVGEPEILLSPPRYVFHHKAEVEVLMQQTEMADTDAGLDRLLEYVGRLLAVDTSLSGLVDYMHVAPPEFVEQAVDGGLPIKAAIVQIVPEYISENVLI